MGLHVVHKLQAWAQSWNGTDGLLFCIGMGRARSGGILQAWAHIMAGTGNLAV